MPDDNLNFPQIAFNISGIIGYPVIAALKELHINNKGILSIPFTPNNKPAQNPALSQSTQLIKTRSKRDTLIFRFDTGAAYTALFSNYLSRYKQYVLENSLPEKKDIMSIGGAKNIDTYTLSALPLTIGRHRLKLHNISVYADEVHDAGRGIVMGNMGQDVIAMFSELTINFERMYINFK